MALNIDGDYKQEADSENQCSKMELEDISTLESAHIDDENGRVKRVRRKVDARLAWMLSLVYMWAFIDRANLGNANIAGMGKDLDLTKDGRYSTLAMLFFVPYILVDLPSALAVRKIGATIWIPSIVLAWGVVTIAQGFVHSWGALLACRLLLGTFEGGLVPSAMFLISVWYTRYEAHQRLAVFYVLGIASTGFSGLLAYGIEKMNGDANLAGWRWIFIIEGTATCVCAIAAYFLLIDFPEKATKPNLLRIRPFLSSEEAALILARIEKDRGDSTPEELNKENVLRAAKDWKIWEFNLYVVLNNTALYAFSYFLPVILQGSLHYSTSKAQLFTFPPYAVAVVWIMLCGWLGDKYKLRGPILIFNCVLYIIGISMTGFSQSVSVRYGGVFIGVLGITANVPTNLAYQHNNTTGQAKRALGAALITTGSGLGGIIAGNIFQAKQAPDYTTALCICIAFQALNIVLVCKNFFLFSRANRKAERGELLIEGIPGFRYTY